MEPNSSILSVNNLSYQYDDGAIMSFPDFDCLKNEKLLIAGNSGKGKTTLIYLIAGLLKLQAGEIILANRKMSEMSLKKLDLFRGKHVGLVFQSAQFISALNVVDNVLAGQFFAKEKIDKPQAMELLQSLGIDHLAYKSPRHMSGGERQRLSIARALISKPDILIADEPTSALDDENTEVVYDILNGEAQKAGSALIIVSHDHRLKSKFEKQIVL